MARGTAAALKSPPSRRRWRTARASSLRSAFVSQVGLLESPADVDGALTALAPDLARAPGAAELLAEPCARRALEHGARMARDPAVQRAWARELGVAAAPDAVEGEDAADSEVAALRAVVAAYEAELAELRKNRGDANVAEQLVRQREALSTSLDSIGDASLPPTPAEASDSEPDEEVRELVARLRRGDAPAPPAKHDDDDDADYTRTEAFLGIALAVASLLLLVAATRRVQPFVARKTGKIIAAAMLGVVGNAIGKFSSPVL